MQRSGDNGTFSIWVNGDHVEAPIEVLGELIDILEDAGIEVREVPDPVITRDDLVLRW